MTALLLASIAFVAWQLLPLEWALAPASWALVAAGAWTAHLLLRPHHHPLAPSEQLLVVWGFASCLGLLSFLQSDPSFQGWGDVYFFCGRDMRHCSCDFRWNARGWRKAAALWSFVLSAALGAQRLLVQLGLDGFLPGEEGITWESFVSVCWRLVPYYLNQWEAKWGAETSSMVSGRVAGRGGGMSQSLRLIVYNRSQPIRAAFAALAECASTSQAPAPAPPTLFNRTDV